MLISKPQGPWLDYLSQENKESAYDIKIEVLLKSEYDSTPAMTDETDVPAAGSNSYHMSKCNTKNVVFSFPQMLAHHTAGGCPMRTGDLIATGTLSGKTRSEYGCLLESTKDGIEPYEVVSTFDTNTKLRRTFLEDGDSITFKAKAQGQGAIGNVGFGTCQGGIRASL